MVSNQSHYSITPVRKSDIPFLSKIESRSFSSDFFSIRQMNYHLNNPRAVFLACRDNLKNPVGYALFFIRKTGNARFYSLVVDKEHRGKGLAKELITKGIKKLKSRGMKAITLEVDSKDKKAINLYKNFEFKKIRNLPEYYEDGRDAIKMKKEIK